MKKGTLKLSLCMIVKNEEEFLKNCLQHICKEVNEIVIVDTGSTDGTKKVAHQFTNNIYDFSWCDDFSKARNFSLLKASNDWILVLDADEIVTELDQDSIATFTLKNAFSVGRIKRINYIEDDWGKKCIAERINRIFNRQFFHYAGIIHEQIVHKKAGNYSTFPVGLTVDHIGYNKEMINIHAKAKRNITLLQQAISNNPDDPYLYYQLGKSYYLAKDYGQAYDSFHRAFSLPINFAYEYAEDLVESYGYALINCHKYTEALDLENYWNYYQNSPDFCFLMGLIYMNNAQFSKAVESFLQCIGAKEGKMQGINSYLPNYNIGVIYESLGFRGEAIEYYRKCGAYELAKKRFTELIQNTN